MLTIKYNSKTYTVDTSSIDSDYLQSIKESTDENEVVELSLFEDIFNCMINNDKSTLFSLDREYTFNGLTYFGCDKLLKEFLNRVKKEIYDNEKRVIQSRVEDFIERYISRISTISICKCNLSEEFFERHLDKLDWYFLCQNIFISEEFFERHSDKINWYFLCQNISISEEFFERHLDKVDWITLSLNTSFLSDSFVKKHSRQFVLSNLCRNKTISQSCFEYILDLLIRKGVDVNHISNRINLSLNTSLSDSFFEKYTFAIEWPCICYNTSVSEAFFEQRIENINARSSCWKGLSANTNVSESFFEKHIDKVDWRCISFNKSISEEFFERHIDKIKWYFLCQNISISEAFYEKYIDKVDWESICQNTSLSESFYEKYIDKVKWEWLFTNTSISESFYIKHKTHIDDSCWKKTLNYSSSFSEVMSEYLLVNNKVDKIYINTDIDKKTRDKISSTSYYSFDCLWKKLL